ncbi:MAG: hypothetical protein HQL97_10080, partial [Magnetococcales bacterium]|nr:hypothetical protein [Magnetococcales bacterium]
MVGQWIKRRIAIAALALFGLGASLGDAQAVSVTGTVGAKAIVVAVNANNETIQAVETQPNSLVPPIIWGFTLPSLPAASDITLYFFMEGKLYPMIFSSGTESKDAFQLVSATATCNVGFVSNDWVNNSVHPSTLLTCSNPSTTAKRTTINFTSIQNTALNPFPNMDLPTLIQYGNALFNNEWYVVADKFYAQAEQLATTNSSPMLNQARVLHAVSQVFSVLNTARSVANTVTTDYANGTATLGDLLAGFGCDKRHLGISGMLCANPMPATAPTGADIKGWVRAHAIPKLTDALGRINQVPDTMTSFPFRDPNDPWDLGTMIDYGDVQVIKGAIEYGLAQLYMLGAYDWSVDVDDSQHKTIEQVLGANATLGTLASDYATQLTTAKSHASSAIDALLAGLTAIQSRTSTTDTFLITLVETEITNTQTLLNEIKSSLSAATDIHDSVTSATVRLNLSKLFDGIGLRAMVPPFLGDALAGLFPDPTMGGIFPDNKFNFAGDSLNADSNGDGIPDILQDVRMYVPTTTTAATITVDGVGTEWTEMQPVITDPASDVIDYITSIPLADVTPYGAADFRGLFIARDDSKVYFRIERASDAMPTGFTATYSLMFTAINSPTYDVTYIYLSGNSVNCYHNSQTFTPASYAVSGQTVEISCPLTAFMNLTGQYRVDVYSSVWKSGAGQYTEYNDMARLNALTFGPKPTLATGGGGGGTTPTTLSLSTTTLSLNVGQSGSVTVSGGTTPYSFMIDPPSAGVISLSNTTTSGTTVSCLKAGISTLMIPDSGTNNQAQTGSVAVTCNAVSVPFNVDPGSLSLNVGAKSTLLFSGGSGSYSINVDNSGVISLGEITSTSAEIWCMKAGSSTVGVFDTASHTASVPVTCTAVPATTLSYDPVNLTVGSGSRSLSFPTGTTVTVQSGTDVITGSASGVSCLKAGTATVNIANTSLNTEGTTTVRCVDEVPAVTSTSTARWVFPTPDITMVMQARWVANGSSVNENFLDYSRTGGSTTLKDRNVSIQATSWGEIYYTHDANGLTIHGEKENNLGTNASTRTIHYGLINAPNLASAGVVSADLAETNLTTPPARMPHDLTSGVVSPQYVVRYALDGQGNIIPSSWTLIKTEITVTPNVNLLAATPPTERANDTYFAHWRDTITHPDLLNKISRVARIQMVESRYTTLGSTTPSSQFTSHMYQAQDLGTVYEVTSANNGVWKGGLTAMTSVTGELKSLSVQQVKTRKVRIDAPTGMTLNNAYVWTRGDHTTGAFASNPHGHNAVSLINETPNTNSALFTLFNRLDPPAADQVEVLNVTYGALGFMPKTIQVQTSAITDPQVLTLTQADQQGQPVVSSSGPVRSTAFYQFSEVPPAMSLTTVTLSPVNLSVDDTHYRALNLPTNFGTPTIEVISVSTPDMIMGDPTNGVKCLKEGTAQVKITFGTEAQGSTTVNCVAPAPADTLVKLPEWLFPQDTTLVTHGRWQKSGPTVHYDYSLEPSRAIGAGTWQGRDVLVMRHEGGGEEYYTLDETHGLAFHGEKRFEHDRNAMVRAVNFGLINPPNLTTGITSDDLAESNRSLPMPLVSGTLTGEQANTLYTARFEVDEAGNLKSDKWSVTKTEISVNGNVNLLSPVPPTEFFSSTDGSVDGYFTSWRDSVTDPELLKKLTHALHVKVKETRYEALGTLGVANAVSQTNHIYMVEGLGVVYERNKENDGIWKGSLWAYTDPAGLLHSVTFNGVSTRDVEIVGPEGSVLTGAYVNMHADHSDTALYNPIHTHNATGWFKEASGNSVKFITFNRVNAPDNDKVTTWNVNYGAEGFVQKNIQVDAAPSYSFALTEADRINPNAPTLTATLSPQNLIVGVQGSIAVSGGTPTYRYETSGSLISVFDQTATGAKVSCSDVVTGTVTVFDAANHSVVVDVVCTAQTGGGGGTGTTLTITPNPLNLTVGVPGSLSVTGGAVPYQITKSGDSITLSSSATGASVTCTAVGYGSVTVLDNENHTASVPVTCTAPTGGGGGSGSMVVTPSAFDLIFGLGNMVGIVTATGGTPPYDVTAADAILTIQLSETGATVRCTSGGETTLTVRDHNNQTASIPVSCTEFEPGSMLSVFPNALQMTVGNSGKLYVSGNAPFDYHSTGDVISTIQTDTGATVTCESSGTVELTVKDANNVNEKIVTVTCNTQSGGGDTNTTLILDPINMTVGSEVRSLKPSEPMTIGPMLEVVAGSDVLEVSSYYDAEIKCLKAGTATLGVTIGSSQGTRAVTCIDPPTTPDTAISIAQWLFPADTTLVSHGRWQYHAQTLGGMASDVAGSTTSSSSTANSSRVYGGSSTNDDYNFTDINTTAAYISRLYSLLGEPDPTLREEYSMHASLAHGTTTFKDRPVSVERNGDGESYYTMDGNGLTFHGEKRVDFWQNRTSRTINFGFKTEPDAASGITAALLAPENLTTPKPFVPATMTSVDTRTLYAASFELDANDQILTDKWTVTKTEITITPNVNLLAATPPVPVLQNHGYFAHWRDSIIDADLLQTAMHALHVKMVETRYHPGDTNHATQTNHVFLGQGVGQLFEHNEESDGLWSGALRATIDATGNLKSLTTDPVAIQQVDVVGPEGAELKGAYVQARAEHMDTTKYNPPHAHHLTGWFTSKPNDNTARFALFTRVNPPENDKVSEWNMNFGADGYVRKHESVPTETMGNPHTLTLTTADQGIGKQFRVTLADGTPVHDAGLQIVRFDGTQCVNGPGEGGSYYNLGDEGKVTVTLTLGSHCVGVWPNNGSGSFTGGWYDSSAASGTVNVKNQLTNDASFIVSVSSGELVLIVGNGGGGTPDMVTISGTITDGTHGLGNVQIRATSTSGAVYTFTTLQTGAFTMTLPVGTYAFKFSYSGGTYDAEAYLQSISETGIQLSAEDDNATPIPVQQALTLPVIMLTSEYQSGGGGTGGGTGGSKITVSGTVTNNQGGLKGIQVEFQPDWNNNTGNMEWVTVKSDENGAYTASIMPGKYRVQFRSEYWDNNQMKMVKLPGVLGWGGYADGKGSTTEMWNESEVFDFSQATTLNALMPSGVLVSGVVKNANNEPVQGVKVELQPDWESESGSAEWRDTITDQYGNYSIFVKKGSVYRIFFNTNYWNWETQEQVKRPGLGGYSTGSTENSTVNGNYDAAKKYRIDADTVVNAQLIAGLTIKGKVTSGATTPLNNIPVRFQPEWDSETNSNGSWGEVRTNEFGEYTFDAQPGKYRIEIPNSTWRWDEIQAKSVEEKLLNGLVGGFADGEGHVTQDWSSAKVFEVKSSVTVDMALVTGMTLSGKVVRSDGTPVKGASVSVHTHDWNRNFN